jgi:hypothetical protein
LPNLDAIDGAAVRWDGTWSVDQDSLRFEFDRFQVDAIGTLPLLGEVSVPVYRQELAPAQRVTVAYTYHVNGQLVLRGAAVSAGLATEAVEQQTAALSPLGREVLALVAQTLAAAFRGSDANEYVFVRL